MRGMSRVFERLPPGKLTYEDYVGLPDDGRRYEILDGELEVSPAPTPRHQGVSGNLFVILHPHVQERGLGRVYHAPIDVILAADSIVQPDLVFVAAGRESIITERAIEGPPDLAVEILSPGSDRRDRVAKAALYARYGIRHYWIPDPLARTLEVYEVEGAEYRRVAMHEGAVRVRTALFPDLEIDLGRVWG
jgi:Uma2 family endonuclease